MARQSSARQLLTNNGLSLSMFGLFAVCLMALSLTGFVHYNEELAQHRQATQSFGSYLASGNFLEAIFENWESEFLQMAVLVIATIFLYQKGAADSKKLRTTQADVSSRHAIIKAWHNNSIGRVLYANSLSIALLSLFVISLVFHALSGSAAYNQEAAAHGQASLNAWQYAGSAQFWFESFQNWQSEFLAVGVLLVLSIYLRQQGSPESKSMHETNQQTGR